MSDHPPYRKHRPDLAEAAEASLWANIKRTPLREMLFDAPPAPQGTDISFEAVARAAGDTKLGDLSTADLIAVTSGLVNNLRNTPGMNNESYIMNMKLAWQFHDVQTSGANTPTHQDAKELGANIAAMLSKEKANKTTTAGELTPIVLDDLQFIHDKVNALVCKLNDTMEVEAVKHWAGRALKNASIQRDAKTNTYRIEVRRNGRQSTAEDIYNYLVRMGVESSGHSQGIITVTPVRDSPIESALHAAYLAKQEIGR